MLPSNGGGGGGGTEVSRAILEAMHMLPSNGEVVYVCTCVRFSNGHTPML